MLWTFGEWLRIPFVHIVFCFCCFQCFWYFPLILFRSPSLRYLYLSLSLSLCHAMFVADFPWSSPCTVSSPFDGGIGTPFCFVSFRTVPSHSYGLRSCLQCNEINAEKMNANKYRKYMTDIGAPLSSTLTEGKVWNEKLHWKLWTLFNYSIWKPKIQFYKLTTHTVARSPLLPVLLLLLRLLQFLAITSFESSAWNVLLLLLLLMMMMVASVLFCCYCCCPILPLWG